MKFLNYSAQLASGNFVGAHVVCKAVSGLSMETNPEVMPCAFQMDRETFYLDTLNGSDHNDGAEHRPFRTMLRAAEAAADPQILTNVRIFVRGSGGDHLVLTLQAAILAVIAEEAMYAPLPDGWERSRDGRGRVYYHNKWLANRAPSYSHPLDETFQDICATLQKLEVAVARECQQMKSRLDELPEFPSAGIVENDAGTSPIQRSLSKGGGLYQFLSESALEHYEQPLRALGASLPEHLRDIDGDALASLGMAMLEQKRFQRVIYVTFPEAPEELQVEAVEDTGETAVVQQDIPAKLEDMFLDRQIVIVGAKGLRKTDVMGKSDPYAVLTVDDVEIGKTEVVPKTLDPVWESSFNLKLNAESVLKIELFDHDSSSLHDFLGQLEIPLGQVASSDLTFPVKTIALTGKDGRPAGKKVQGVLTVVLNDPQLVRPTVQRQLIIASASGLLSSDRSLLGQGSSDPYAVVYWNDTKIAQTEVVQKTLEPVWEKQVMIKIPDRGGDLRIEVFDHDIGSAHDFLGEIRTAIGVGPEWDDNLVLAPRRFPLQQKEGLVDGGAQVQGTLTLRLENPIIRRLVVMSASGIRAADRARSVEPGGGKRATSDPFGVVYWDGYELGQTPVDSQTLNPIWDADFTLAINPAVGYGTLRIVIFDHDVGSRADFLGQLEVDVGEMGYGGAEAVFDRRVFALQARPEKPLERIPGSIAIRVEDPTGLITADMIGRPMTPRGMFEVTLLEGKNLKKMDTFGKNDPYVIVTVNGETRQSSTVESGGSKPVWGPDGNGEMLVFEVETALSVEVACYDEDQGSADDLIGTAIIELDHQPENRDWAMEEWFEITDAKSKLTGSLHLHLSWSNPRPV